MQDFEADELVKRLSPRFKANACVLFTGAGFSRAASDLDGNVIPGGAELAERIWHFCYPKEDYDGSSLDTIFPLAIRTRPEAAVEFLRRNLTVNQDSMPEFYEYYFRLHWFRIYTLNIDTIMSAASTRFRLPTVLSVASSRRDTPTFNPHASSDGRPVIQCVHLHGTLNDLPGGVTFSHQQYSRAVVGSDPWFGTLSQDLSKYTTVFVGTQLNEPHLWQHIEFRSQHTGAPEDDIRPTSYLLLPDELPKGRREMLKTYRIRHIQTTAREFAEKVLARIDPASPLTVVPTDPVILTSVSRLRATSPPPDPKVKYLVGSQPTWADIQSGNYAQRVIMRTLEAKCRDMLQDKSDTVFPVALTGTAGCGKTTVLMAVAARLDALGLRCHFVAADRPFSYEHLFERLASTSPDVVVLDDIHRSGRTSVLSVLETFRKGASGKVLLFSVPSFRLDKLITRDETNRYGVSEVPVPNLEDSDIDGLLAVLERGGLLGDLAELSYRDRVRTMRKQMGRQLLAAMIKVTSGDELRERVGHEYESMDAVERRIYSLLVYPTLLGSGLVEQELMLAIAPYDTEKVAALKRMNQRGLTPFRHPGRYVLRHPIIAEEMETHLRAVDRLKDAILTLLPVLGIRAKERDRPAENLLRRMINHDFLRERLAADAYREVYAACEGALSWSHHYWLQRAESELADESPVQTLQFLHRAHDIAPDDWLVNVAICHANLQIACSNPLAADADVRFKRAVDDLLGVIERFAAKGPHAFHILGKYAMSWSKRASVPLEEKKLLLETVLAVLRKGRALHPFSRELEDQFPKVQAAYLGTAVSD